MKVTLCDVEDCDEYARLSLKILADETFEGITFDACSTEHVAAYLAELSRELPEAEEDVAP